MRVNAETQNTTYKGPPSAENHFLHFNPLIMLVLYTKLGMISTSRPHYVARSPETRYRSPQILLVLDINLMYLSLLRLISGATESGVALYVSARRLLPPGNQGWTPFACGLTPMWVIKVRDHPEAMGSCTSAAVVVGISYVGHIRHTILMLTDIVLLDLGSGSVAYLHVCWDVLFGRAVD